MATGMLKTDPTLLGKDFKTAAFNTNWTGYEGDDISSGIARTVMDSPELLAKLGLTAADIGYTGSTSAENDPYGNFRISDAARKALTGLTVSRTGVAGKKDGRSQVIRDAAGNILYTGNPYSYDPAGDLKDAAIKAAAVMAAAYGGAQALGLNGGAGAAGATGAAGEAGASALSGLDAAALDAGAGLSGGAGGSVIGAAEAAGAAGAAGTAGTAGAAGAAGAESALGALAGDSATKAALFGEVGYGAGMSGAATSAFDTVLAMTGSTSLAATAGSVVNGGSWLSNTWGALTGGSGGAGVGLLGGLFSGSGVLRDLLPLIGAGVQQYNLEKMLADQRAWQDNKESDARRRRMPTTGTGMLGKFRVIPGAGNGG